MSPRPLAERGAVLALALGAWLTVGAAGSGAGPGAADAAADTRLTLERLMAEMARSRGVVARFREVKEVSLLSAPIETRGELAFAPPDRFVRRTREPAATALYVDAEQLVFRDEAGGETVDLAADPVARRFVENLVVLWSGDLEALRERYEVSFEAEPQTEPQTGPAGETDPAAGARWQLRLRPRSAPMRDFVREIALRGAGPRLETMVLVESDGDRTTTTFEALETDHVFSAEELERTFRPPAP